MSYPLPVWTDGDFHSGTRTGLPEFSSPIPGVATEYLLRQKWQQFRSNFAPAALDGTVTHPDYASYLLVEESPRVDLGNGVVQWDRTYAQVPATHYDWTNVTYSFIGLTQSIGGGATQTRTRRSWVVKCMIQYDYALAPGSGTYSFADPIFGTYNVTNPGDIKTVLDMQYCSQAGNAGTVYGGITIAQDSLNLEGTVLPTWPSADQYVGMISDALTNGWGASKAKVVVFPGAGTGPVGFSHVVGVIDTTNSVPAGADASGNAKYSGTAAGGLIPVEPSTLTRWIGNIHQRATKYVLAQ